MYVCMYAKTSFVGHFFQNRARKRDIVQNTKNTPKVTFYMFRHVAIKKCVKETSKMLFVSLFSSTHSLYRTDKPEFHARSNCKRTKLEEKCETTAKRTENNAHNKQLLKLFS